MRGIDERTRIKERGGVCVYRMYTVKVLSFQMNAESGLEFEILILAEVEEEAEEVVEEEAEEEREMEAKI